MGTKSEKFCLYNTMTGIVAGLENEYTTIDLRNEAIASGKISNVDGRMNIEMEDVTFQDAKGVLHTYPTFYIPSRTIRHVHIPKHLNPTELFERQQKKMTAPKRKEAYTYKKVRAKRYQEQTVKQAFQKE